jgi:hypothetical protein
MVDYIRNVDVRPLEVLHRPINMDSNFQIEDAARTQANYVSGTTNSFILDARTRNGVLSGSVATIKANWTTGKCTETRVPFGIYTDFAVPDPWTNDHVAATSGITVAHGGGTFIGYIFETHDSLGNPILDLYRNGYYLYCSPNGLLTPEVPSSISSSGLDIPIGIIAKLPTIDSLSLGFTLII